MTLDEYVVMVGDKPTSLEKRIALWHERLRISHAIKADPYSEICALVEESDALSHLRS